MPFIISTGLRFNRLLRQHAFWLWMVAGVWLLTHFLRAWLAPPPPPSPSTNFFMPAGESRLIYLVTTENGNLLIKGPASSATDLAETVNAVQNPLPPPQTSLSSLPAASSMCQISDLYPSFDGTRLVAQNNCEAGSYVLVVNVQTGQIHNPAPDLGHTLFLGWTPAGAYILRADQGYRYAVFRVHPTTGEAQPLPVPEMSYHIAPRWHPDALLSHLGFGLWQPDLDCGCGWVKRATAAG